MLTPTRLLCLDCDATLSGIEGIDELARLRGPAVLAEVAAMTQSAMDGRIPIEEVFGRRLDIIKPSRTDVATIGAIYVANVEPEARAAIASAKAAGWTPVILSAGYTQSIVPLAAHLGIDRIEAVTLKFDAAGNYAGFDREFPTTRSGGKPVRVEQLKREFRPVRTVMVGDGVSDLETKPVVDLFVGFGRYADRPRVREGSAHFIRSFAELMPLL
ncbi:MAG TPA: HAD-IB family phosphatase [Candidatus Didemnitutus sp.]|nr:HAD-IB family phosphatase [Candidatus Didemnitutus sp.]